MDAILALEDGMIWRGKAFGGSGDALGEVCFNTSMTGYQEILTDPSYRGQIVTMTYPEIGNYGVNDLDAESCEVQVAGFVVRRLAERLSNQRSEMSLEDYLKQHKVPGIMGIDTRALTLHLRSRGALRGVITTEKISDTAAVDLAKSFDYGGRDFVKEVTCKKPYVWDPEDKLSRRWTLIQGARPQGSPPLSSEDYFAELDPPKHNIIAYDFGCKRNILRLLRQHGFRVKVVPATTPAADVLAEKPDGVFLSNGPGDPEALDYVRETVLGLLGKTPLFGICLGHEVLGMALGGRIIKLKFGHRGGNQPVKDLESGKISITAQNHGYALDPDSLPADQAKVTHLNLNDQTCAGLCHLQHPAFSVQYHPEAAPGPHDADYFFSQFSKMIDQVKSAA
ncbi:MAG: glutamine-hydrolyzing carbamoyl-phosphate synthase small subunit [Verrucomicrobiota bacterium]